MCFPVFGLFFSFNNQTIVYICVLARSHKEEHPNKGEKSQTGKWAGKENPDSLPWVPMNVGFKVHRGGRGDRRGRGLWGLPGDTKMVTSEARLHLVSRCHAVLKSLSSGRLLRRQDSGGSSRQRLGAAEGGKGSHFWGRPAWAPPPPQPSAHPQSHWRKEGAEPYLTRCPGPRIDGFYFCSQPTGWGIDSESLETGPQLSSLGAALDFAQAGFAAEYENSTGFPGGSDGKDSACNAGDLALIPGWRRSPGEGNGNPLQNSCMENLAEEPGRLQSMLLQRVRHDFLFHENNICVGAKLLQSCPTLCDPMDYRPPGSSVHGSL